MTSLCIGTEIDLRPVDDRFRQLYVDQAERLRPILDGLSDDAWQTQSRNSEWTVQQTLQHVAGVRMENVRRLKGEPPAWTGGFDPNKTPQHDIDTRAGESPRETVDGLFSSTSELVNFLAERSDSDERRPMLWGEKADFRLFFIHVHWDALVHERDALAPLGIDSRATEDELRFSTAYGLLIAGVALKMAGTDHRAELTIEDLGRVELVVSGSGIQVDIDAASPSPGARNVPSSTALVDALSGRGRLADVLDAPDDEIKALSGFASFLNPGAA